MDKLIKLYNAFYIAFFICVCGLLVYKYYQNKPIDANGNNEYDTNEIQKFVAYTTKENEPRPAGYHSIVRSSLSGMLRGVILGLILHGAEGAITSGAVLAVVNPLVLSIEHML